MIYRHVIFFAVLILAVASTAAMTYRSVSASATAVGVEVGSQVETDKLAVPAVATFFSRNVGLAFVNGG